MQKKKNVSKIIISMALALLLVFGILASPLLGSSKAYAATTRQASTWAELRDAISDSANGDVIEITQDIMACKAKDKNGNDFTTIDISGAKTVTIKAKDGENVTIYRKKGESDFPMFKTSNEKAGIILGEGLTLTGQQVEGDCSFDSGFTVTFSNGGNPEKTGTKTFNGGEELYINPPEAGWSPGNGYQFVGWKYKKADGSVSSSKGNTPPAATGYTLPTGKKGEMTVVAEYERTNFVVTWSNGVSGDGAKTEVWDLYGVDGATKQSVGESLSKTPEDDWKPGDGYVFKGWKYILSEGADPLTSTDGNVVDGSGTQVKMGNTATNMTIVAQWEKPAASSEYHLKEKVGNKKLVYDTGGRVLLRDISREDPNYKYVRVVSINSDGVITANVTGLTGEQYVICQGGNLKVTPSSSEDYVKAHSNTGGDSGTPATTSTDPIYLYSIRWPKGYIYDFVDPNWKLDNTGTKTPKQFVLVSAGGGGGGGSPTPYTSQVDPEYDDHDPEVYPTAVQPSYSESTPSQGCDGNCTTYTKDDFAGGESGSPRGFFVQVEAGTVSLEGATLENFNTSTTASNTPKFVAPVAVIGENATFDVKSGNIQNNIVGYIADDNKSGEGANAIKMYVKGAAPNARRKNAPDRRHNNAELDITGTAGAVIYANGAQGTISGGSIGYNRGDTGGIMVSDEGSFLTITTGADINHNVGVQFGGGTTAEDGGSIYMNGGEIHDNVAWFGGGAAFVTENGIDWLLGEKSMTKADRKDGSFTLANGEIYGNSAFTRGGGFLVDSDGVAFLGGNIHNNTSRVLGGAAYVMGDHPDYSYTLYIEQGDIKNNEAIDANTKESSFENMPPISKKLVAPANNCETPTGSLYGGDAQAASTDDIADFQRINDGTGGGVWVCSYGSTVLDLNPNYVSISNNTAAGATGDPNRYTNRNTRLEKANAKNKESGGQDFHSDNGGDGTLLMLPSGNTDWYDENEKAKYTADGADGEIRNLTNQDKSRTNQGVQIYNNASRRGGGLAADGTYVFGPQRDIARIAASLDISKAWDASIPVDERKPVIIRVGVESGDKKAVVEDVELDGKANATDEESLHENEGTAEKWSGGFNLPVSVDDGEGNKITVFKLKGSNGVTYDPTNMDDMADLATALNTNPKPTFTLSSDATLTFEELVATEFDGDGNPTKFEKTDEFEFSPGSLEVGSIGVTVNEVTRVNAQGVKEHVLNVSFAEVPLTAPVRNEVPKEEIPGPEKYIDKVVHTSLPAFDEKFEYAVLAYVPKDATEVVLTDTLEEPLEFVNKTKKTVLSGFYVLAENDSKGDGSGTVATTPRDKVEGNTLRIANGVKTGDRKNTELTLNGNTVTLTLKEGFLQGKVTEDDDAIFKKEGKDRDGVWVMMTFDAQYNKDYYDLAKVKDNTQNGDSWLENADDKSGGAALTYVQNNAEVRQNANTNKYIIKLGDKYYNSSDAKEWTDVTKDADYYVARWDGKGDPIFNKLEGNAILDVKGIAIPDEAGITANGFVKDAEEEHSGTKNQAEYELTRGNNPASDYKTNIVTVDAPSLKLEAEKKWSNMDGTDTWPTGVESVEVDIYRVDTATQAETKVGTIVLNAAEPKKQSEELPKLNNATYRLDEVTVDGYTTASEDMANDDLIEGSEFGKVFTNTEDSNEKPEIEKYVNEAVHKDITLDEVFTYDILAYVTKDATEVTITDTLVPYLDFATGTGKWYVQDIGPNNNHKVTNDVTNKRVNEDASVSYLNSSDPELHKMNGDYPIGLGNKAQKEIKDVTVGENATKQLFVKIADATPYRGHWIKVHFTAKIKEGLTLEDLQAAGVYREVKGNVVNEFDVDRADPKTGNAPVKAGATHTGVPNKAEYEIQATNEAEYSDSSNTVTVKPKTTEVTVSKEWLLDGETADWPEGATIEVKLQSKKGNDNAKDVLDAEERPITETLDVDKQSYTFENLPVLEDVTYSVAEGEVTNAGDYTIGEVEEVSEGVFKITNTGTTPEEPEIEKYVNKKSDEGEAKDGGVHTDLAAFDEVYTYDIQAYITSDAKYVEVTDELKEVLEFVGDAPTAVVIKEGKGEDGKTAPKLSKEGTALEAAQYAVDAEAWASGKLVLTMGATDATEVVEGAGKWLQITFDAKIKDAYRSIDAIKGVAGAWATVKKNAPIDDATVDALAESVEADKSKVDNHAGIVNDASYTINVGVDNAHTYNDSSNKVTVKPSVTKLVVSKVWVLDGKELAADKWPEGATVEVKLQSKKGEEEAKDVKDSKDTTITATLSADQQNYIFDNLPVLEGVTYSVAEGAVENAGDYEIGSVEAVEGKEGEFKITNTGTTPEEPEIEKYVNKKSDEGTAKDGGVHTDLEAFDEVYTYDIQAYIAKDATVAEVTDELQSVLEFVGDAPTAVVVKEGESDGTAPKLSKAGNTPEDSYKVDEAAWAAGKLVLTLGDAESTEVLKSAGKWLQITFDAKIKDDYRSIQALKDAGADVWVVEKGENDPIDDDTVDESHSGATIGKHEGIVNDSSYKMKKAGVDVGNTWTYNDDSNKVTVQPKTTKVEVSKKWIVDGADAEWPEGATVEVKLTAKDESGADKLADTKLPEAKTKGTLTSKETYTFEDLPCLEGVTYGVEEGTVTDPQGTAAGFAFGAAEETEEGKFVITNTKGEKPEIEKYVNKKSDEGTAKDGGVHTDLAAFDEVYTYDIQAYITSDAKYVEVTDELKKVFEFAEENPTVTVVVKEGEGENGMTAPKLSKAGTALTASDYKVDADAWTSGKLVLTMGATDATEVVEGAGKWLQITFDAKIKDAYRSIDAIKGVAGAWATVKKNAPIDDATVDALKDSVEADKSKVNNHAGIVNDASYTINVGVENAHTYKDSSNKVTVKPSVTKLVVSKVWVLDGEELASDKWPEGATVEVKVIGKDGDVAATDTLSKDKQSVTFDNLPKLEGVTYSVEEGTVTNAGAYEIGSVEAVEGKEGEFKITNTGTTPEEPEIEKYVNKKSDEGTAKDGGVHTDLEAFDEVYTYDIQAYIAKDATVAEVTDELVKVLEFVGERSSVKVVVKEGEEDGKAPKLSKAGQAPEDNYTVDADAWNDGKLVLTLGDAESTEVLKSAGKWLQITFDAKIKDDYRSIQALKDAGAEVWVVEEGENDPIDDDTVDESHSKATIEKHEGITNDSSYKMKKAGVDVGNTWTYSDDSNTVTVQPKTTEVKVQKQWKNADGSDMAWPTGVEIEVKLLADGEPVKGQTLKLKNGDVASFTDLPVLEGVEYTVEESPATVDGTPYMSEQKTENGVIVITNKPEKPELEKYVNKDVTWDFTNFDQVFTYDVMAYVTNDADTLTVTDTINSMLEFVGENGSLKIADLGTTNNHKTTVKNKGKDITAQAKTATASGSDVKVVIEDLEAKGLRGHWIKVTFDARIKDTVYETVAQLIKDRTAEEIKDTDSAAATSNKAWVEITDNGSVKIDTDHDGIPNRAHYELKVGDSGKHELDSNTVTVEPKTTTVWAKKTWQDEKGNIATWPKEVTEVTVNVYGADKETPVCTITLKDGNAVESEVLPCLEGVEYTVDEVTVPGYTEVGEVQGTGTEDDPYVFTNKKNAGPEIEKYVNKKDATPEQRDGTVHTDLSAFDEVYTYDIQAYITKDAKYVEVIDQLVDVLEFTERADESFKVVVKDGDGEDGITAPALSKEPLSMEVRWSADFGTGKAGQLVVVLGSDDKDAPVLPYAGKWIQITFDAKIKDEFKTVEALKAKGINVWTTIKENDPVEDADTTIEFSGATAGSHEGIINESSYYINKIAGADIGNEWQYSDRSNVVTVQPPTPVKEFPVYFSKNELGGSEIEGAHIVVNDEKGKLVEEWDSTTESHKLDLKPGKYTMEETVAPEGFQKVTTVIEFEVDKDGKVTLITTEVNGGGKISVTDINHVILEDAPKPTESSDKEKQAPDNDSGNDKTDKTNNDDVSRIDDKTKAKSGNASGRKSSANTGDENNASLWFLLIIAAAVALPFAIKKVRQK